MCTLPVLHTKVKTNRCGENRCALSQNSNSIDVLMVGGADVNG